jgi:predicted transcriptional regulator
MQLEVLADSHPFTIANVAETLGVTRSALSARIRRRQKAGKWPGKLRKTGRGDAIRLTDAQARCLIEEMPRGWALERKRK